MDKTAENTLTTRLQELLYPGGIMNKQAEEATLLEPETDTLLEETEEETPETTEEAVIVEDTVDEEEEAQATEKVASSMMDVLSHPEVRRGFQETLNNRSHELAEAIEKKAMEYLEQDNQA